MTNSPSNKQEKDSPRRLLRSSDERMLAGVAGGIAQYLDVDPTFVRLGFAAATLFGGFGILVYLIMAVIVPRDDGSGAPVTERPPWWAIALLVVAALVVMPGPFFGWGDGIWFFGFGAFWLVALVVIGALAYRALRGEWSGGRTTDKAAGTTSGKQADRSTKRAGAETATTEIRSPEGEGTMQRLVRLLAIGILALCAVCGAIAVGAMGAFATATGSGEIVAGVVIALGIGLAGMAFIGEGLRRTAPWLLGLALILALPAGAVAAADVRFDGGIGERTYTPASAAEIPSDGYELGVGQMKIDLRRLDLERGDVVEVPASLGLGQLIVSVPSDVCVTGQAEAKAGELLVRGVSNSGASPEFERGPAPEALVPRVDIDADLQFAQLVVTDRDPEDFDDGHDSGRGEADELEPEPEECLG
jgi:phage shock protein PspC (stress-responsive transcriptional regulator)